jgi:hypothetical protein
MPGKRCPMRPVTKHGPHRAYLLDASSRYSARSSALAALSTLPVASQRLAHQIVPLIARGGWAAGRCGTGRGMPP